MEKTNIQTERRQFLFRGVLWAALGLLGASLAWIFKDLWSAASRFSSAHWVSVAPLTEFPREGVFPFPEYKMAIVRVAGKIGAISLECTHLGCLVNVIDRGFFCPCHGSDFGPFGQVYSGPATEPLPWHEVMNRDGRIWVHLGKKIGSPKWLAIRKEVRGTRKREAGRDFWQPFSNAKLPPKLEPHAKPVFLDFFSKDFSL